MKLLREELALKVGEVFSEGARRGALKLSDKEALRESQLPRLQ